MRNQYAKIPSGMLAVLTAAVLTAGVTGCAVPQIRIPAAPAETADQMAEAEAAEAEPEAAGTETAPATAASEQAVQDIEAGIEKISKYGNLTLTVSPDSMRALGYEPADIINVRIGSAEMEMPIGTSYTDADSGEPVCCYKTSSSDGLEHVVLSINAGNLLQTMGLGTIEKTDGDPGYEVHWADGCSESMPVYISMAEKQGFAEEYRLHQVGGTRTNAREDYPDLTDAEYANFREIPTSGIAPGALYRSSSPVNPVLNRNAEADAALLAAGVKTVMNMADSEDIMKNFPDYAQTAYSGCNIIALDMGMDYTAEDYRALLAEGFRFFAENEGPYLIHCREGKDRTGFAAAVLECLMGAYPAEIIGDYMVTFYNYYGITPDSENYAQIAGSNIVTPLAEAFGLGSAEAFDAMDGDGLAACAEAYLQEIGMTAEEIAALRANLQETYGNR